MANVDHPNGLRPVATLGQPSYCGHVIKCVILGADTTDTFVGDRVKLAGSSDATGRYPAVVQGTAGATCCGVVVGIEPQTFTNMSSEDNRATYVSGSVTTDQYVLVDIDPNTLYEVQEDSVGGALTAGSAGLNANIIVGVGDTVSGASAMEIDSSTAATTATLDAKLISIVPREDNALGTNARWIVKLNNHQFASGTGTAGV